MWFACPVRAIWSRCVRRPSQGHTLQLADAFDQLMNYISEGARDTSIRVGMRTAKKRRADERKAKKLETAETSCDRESSPEKGRARSKDRQPALIRGPSPGNRRACRDQDPYFRYRGASKLPTRVIASSYQVPRGAWLRTRNEHSMRVVHVFGRVATVQRCRRSLPLEEKGNSLLPPFHLSLVLSSVLPCGVEFAAVAELHYGAH